MTHDILLHRDRRHGEPSAKNRLSIYGAPVPAATRGERHAFAGVLISELRGSVLLVVFCVGVLLLVLNLT